MRKILEFQPQHQSLQWIFRVNFPYDWQVWSPFCPRDSQESSSATKFKGIDGLTSHLLYHPALTTAHDHWEDHSLTVQTCVSRVMSLLFSTLSRFLIAFLTTSNHLLISWLPLPSAAILEPKKRKSVTTSTFPPSVRSEVMGPGAMVLVF